MGNVALRNKRQRLELYDLLFIPQLNTNIISVSQLDETGKSVVSRNGVTGSLGTAKRVNGLYHLDLYPDYQATVYTGKNLEKHKLWHQRMAHLNQMCLLKMANQTMVH